MDIWSVGIILYLLMSKKVPYDEESVTNLMLAIFSKERPKLSDNYSVKVKDLLNDWILNRDPEKRITIKKIF